MQEIRDSLVLKDVKALKLLHSWVEEEGEIKSFNKIFTATKDGWNTSNFHQKSDNQGPTLTVIRTTQGKVFGGFTKCSWNQNGSWYQDPSTFVYSIDEKQKFKVQGGHIMCNSS